jgi:hypothetical protein
MSILSFGCQGGANPELTDAYIEIDFPLNSSSIYASVMVREHSTSLELLNITMYSLEFLKKEVHNGKTDYTARITEYPVPQVGQREGNLLVTIDDKWVLYQYSNLNNASNMFLKGMTDTTELPTGTRNQFPSYPCKIYPNTLYSVFRPPDAGQGGEFVGVYRQFSVLNYESWLTRYDTFTGLHIKGSHDLFNWRADFEMLVDDKGIVISQLSFGETVLVDESGKELGTVKDYVINERFVDFSNPADLDPLSTYADKYMEQGPHLYK